MRFKLKKIIPYIVAFLLPIVIIMTYIFSRELLQGNYIKGGENFLLADMASQYNSIYAWIWEVLRGNESIFYSFGKGLGGNMASTFGYYGASPFNILYLLCSKDSIPLMTWIIYLLKIGFSSMFMYIFLNNKFKDNKNMNIVFAITYSLMAYTVNYYFNNMWLDVILMTPLVMLGIDKLFNKKSIIFYVVTLSIAIMSNFYISYMLCIFCVIYFIYELLNKYKLREIKEYKDTLLRFTIGSLLAGGLAMFILLPALLNLSEVMRFSLDKSLLNIDFSLWKREIFTNILSKFYIGSHNSTSVLSRNRPNLYCGMLTIVLFFIYFANKKIKIKEKIYTAIVTIFFILSLMIPHLNLFWQAGSFPNGYICRYSFLFSFFLIMIAARSFMKLDKIKFRYFIGFIILYVLISIKISAQYLVFLEHKDIIISSIFVLIYLIILYVLPYIKKKEDKKSLKFLLIVLVAFELFLNFKYCFLTNTDMKVSGNYKNYYYQTCPVINNLDNDFYRVDGDYRYSYLDSWICNTNTITTSLSTNTGDLYRFWKENSGNVTYTTILYDLNKLPIFDSIFGVKYITSEKKLNDSYYDYYKKFNVTKYKYSSNKYEKRKIYIYKNPYALSLGYLIPNNYSEIYKNSKVKDSFQSLNRLMKTISGNDENVLTKYKTKKISKNKYNIELDDEKYIYLSFDYDVSINWSIYASIYINDEYITSSTSDDIGNIKIENKWPNQTITLKVGSNEKETKTGDLVAYKLNMDIFTKDINILKQNQLENIEIKNNTMSASIDVEKDSVLFTSIPYEKGWNVYVDGKKVKYEKIANEFIGIKLNKGKHDIKMKYYSHHIGIGIVISIISLIVLIGYEIFIRKKKI